MMLTIIILICCSTFLGGWIAMHYQDEQGLVTALSAGIVTGVFFFDLLPEAVSLAAGYYSHEVVAAIVALGFIIYLTFDRLALLHATPANTTRSLRANLAAGGLSLHGLFDGLAIGIAFHVSRSAGLLLGVAIIIHAISDGLNTVSVVLQKGGVRKQSLAWLLVNSIAPLAGCGSSFVFRPAAGVLAVSMALFAGFFLYLGASDLLPESLRSHPSWLNTLATLLGFALLFMTSRMIGS